MRPDFIIIGTMKGGTTSLHAYLDAHPQIAMSRPKELNFFIEERNWQKGVAWYESHFRGRDVLRGESSPNYSAYPFFNGVPEHMHAVVPDAKLIYILRDPVERMISHYVHIVSEHREQRPADVALLDTGRNAYLARSQYHMQLQRFLKFYPRDRVLLLTCEELLDQRAQTLRTVFRFLGVRDEIQSWRFSILYHRSRNRRLRNPAGQWLFRFPSILRIDRLWPDLAYHLGNELSRPFSRAIPRPVLSSDVRGELANRLADDLKQLRAFTGRRFEEWSC